MRFQIDITDIIHGFASSHLVNVLKKFKISEFFKRKVTLNYKQKMVLIFTPFFLHMLYIHIKFSF